MDRSVLFTVPVQAFLQVALCVECFPELGSGPCIGNLELHHPGEILHPVPEKVLHALGQVLLVVEMGLNTQDAVAPDRAFRLCARAVFVD